MHLQQWKSQFYNYSVCCCYIAKQGCIRMCDQCHCHQNIFLYHEWTFYFLPSFLCLLTLIVLFDCSTLGMNHSKNLDKCWKFDVIFSPRRIFSDIKLACERQCFLVRRVPKPSELIQIKWYESHFEKNAKKVVYFCNSNVAQCVATKNFYYCQSVNIHIHWNLMFRPPAITHALSWSLKLFRALSLVARLHLL